MENNMSFNDLRFFKKEYIWDIYVCLFDKKDEDYKKITRNKMIDEIIQFYESDLSRVYFILNNKELETLNKALYEGIEEDATKDIYFPNYTMLMGVSIEDFKYGIISELYECVKSSLEEYQKNKENIEKKKEKNYYLLGLLRCYGALKEKEIQECMKDYFSLKEIKEAMDSLYIKRFVKKEKSILFLRGLDCVYKKILRSHPKIFVQTYSYEKLIQIGIDFVDKDSRRYKILIREENLMEPFGNAKFLEEFILYAGMSDFDSFAEGHMFLFCGLNSIQVSCVSNYFNSLPKFIFHDSSKEVILEKYTKLYYRIFPPFLEYCGKQYNIGVERFEDGSYNVRDLCKVYEKCSENHFEFIEDYIKEHYFSNEEKEFLFGLRRDIYGVFVVVKHTKNGTIFMGEDQFYLVKGITDSLSSKEDLKKLPVVVKTALIPMKDEIIYNGFLAGGTISIGPNMKRMIKEELKSGKEIITKL